MRLNSKKVTIEFEVESDTQWLLDQLENQGVLEDLALRAAHEFVRDLRKMNGFDSTDATARLWLAYTGGFGEWERKTADKGKNL